MNNNMDSDSDIMEDLHHTGTEEFGAMSSNLTLMTSLAEHSYCAPSSILPAGSPASEVAVIGDLFDSSSHTEHSVGLCTDLNSPLHFPVDMIGEVNLDGFNYTVPVVSNIGNSEAMELENMWSGLTNETSPTVVEVAATNDNEERLQVGHGSNFADAENEETDTLKQSRLRRTDLIQDGVKRTNHFEIYFKRLIADFHRIKCRTGCMGYISAKFEGGYYDESATKDTFAPTLVVNPLPSSSISLDLSSNGSISTNTEPISHDGMDDHRYAATILTQNISSSAIRDHQYDEKIVISGQESDTTTDGDEDSQEIRIGGKVRIQRKISNRYRYDYIKIRWVRTQTFCKMIKSLFTNKLILEQRTGAKVQLSVEYEHISFDERNYTNASNIISSKHRDLKSQSTSSKSKLVQLKPKMSNQNQLISQTPLSFILPASFPIPYMIPGNTPSVGTSCTNFPLSITVSPNPINRTEAICKTSETFDTFETERIEPDNRSFADGSDDPSIVYSEDDNAMNSSITLSLNVLPDDQHVVHAQASSGTCSPMISTSVVEGVQEGEEHQQLFDNKSLQSSPEVTRSGGMRESSTNTEPFCSICFKSGEYSSSSCTTDSSTKSFWIRCNDPFCYDMVHTACVGFVVTHRAHLKQLPAFYCKAHR